MKHTYIESSALIVGAYRYNLVRKWAEGKKHVCFILCNPSVADEHKPDLTLTKCVRFAQLWGYGSLEIVNIGAGIATDPDDWMRMPDPIGPDNVIHVAAALKRADVIIAGWGNIGAEMAARLGVSTTFDRVVKCWGKTQSGAPLHPSRLGYDTELMDF